MIYVINSPVITSFGEYSYSTTSVDEIKYILDNNEFISVVGHQETATLLTRILGVKIEFNRISVFQEIGDLFIVIKPKTRLDAYKEYTDLEIENIGYELGILCRLK